MHTSEFNPYDLWILSRLSHAQHEYDHYMSKYMLGEALQVVIDFVWNELCDRYIEICKIPIHYIIFYPSSKRMLLTVLHFEKDMVFAVYAVNCLSLYH